MDLNCTDPLTWVFLIQFSTKDVFFLPVVFLTIVRIRYILYVTYKICINRLLSVRILVKSRLLEVFGESKVRFLTAPGGHSNPNLHIVQG